ncbi:MAG: hypothetical protein F9K48_06415, partial [Candidatus Brocadia sp.]
MYLILGCDEIGSTLARNLSRSGEETLVIGNNEAVFVGLKEPNLRTMTADIHTLDFGSLPIKNTIAFILLQKTHTDNLALANRIRKLFPNKFILSQATDEIEGAELSEHGVDRTVQTVRIITNALLNELETAKLKRSVFRLVSVIQAATSKGLAIFLQDNPDPDAIASGFALKRIAEKYDIKSSIYYGGN